MHSKFVAFRRQSIIYFILTGHGFYSKKNQEGKQKKTRLIMKEQPTLFSHLSLVSKKFCLAVVIFFYHTQSHLSSTQHSVFKWMGTHFGGGAKGNLWKRGKDLSMNHFRTVTISSVFFFFRETNCHPHCVFWHRTFLGFFTLFQGK